MTTQKAKKVLLEKNEKQVCNSYIDQSYLFSKYQTLKADTKELVSEYFLKLKQNISFYLTLDIFKRLKERVEDLIVNLLLIM